MFDISKFRNLTEEDARYNSRISALRSLGMNTQQIEKTVNESTNN